MFSKAIFPPKISYFSDLIIRDFNYLEVFKGNIGVKNLREDLKREKMYFKHIIPHRKFFFRLKINLLQPTRQLIGLFVCEN